MPGGSMFVTGIFELLIISVYLFVIVAVVRYLRRASRERQLLRMEVGKLADEVQKLREQQGHD